MALFVSLFLYCGHIGGRKVPGKVIYNVDAHVIAFDELVYKTVIVKDMNHVENAQLANRPPQRWKESISNVLAKEIYIYFIY